VGRRARGGGKSEQITCPVFNGRRSVMGASKIMCMQETLWD